MRNLCIGNHVANRKDVILRTQYIIVHQQAFCYPHCQSTLNIVFLFCHSTWLLQYYCKRVRRILNKLHRAWHMSVKKCISESYTIHCFTVSRNLIKSTKLFVKFNLRFEKKKIYITRLSTNKLPSTKKSEAKRLFITYIVNAACCLEIKKKNSCLSMCILPLRQHTLRGGEMKIII